MGLLEHGVSSASFDCLQGQSCGWYGMPSNGQFAWLLGQPLE